MVIDEDARLQASGRRTARVLEPSLVIRSSTRRAPGD
jgi:hypothetical protein